MRVIGLAIALLVAYIVRRWWGNDPAQRLSHASIAVLVLACLFLLWADQAVSDWGDFWQRDRFEALPWGACAVGAAIGYILADQQSGSKPTEPATDGLLERISQAAKPLATNLVFAVLVLAAVVQPRTWVEILARIQGVKAGAMEITLASARSSDLAQSIRNAAPPRSVDASGGIPVNERTGFVPVRLERMQSYTFPPRLEGVSKPPSIFAKPDGYILSVAREPPLDGTFQSVRQVQRDRALAWKLETLRAGPGDGWWSSLIRSSTAATHPPWIDTLGKTQEQLLSKLAPHVECLSSFVELTKNRRLLQYQNYAIVEHLFSLAHLWSVAEKTYAIELATKPAMPASTSQASARNASTSPDHVAPRAASPDKSDRPSVQSAIQYRLIELGGQLSEFGEWADDFLQDWTARANSAAPSPLQDRETMLAQRCTKEYQKRPLEEILRLTPNSITISDMRPPSEWFTPYLTVFAAQALSAMGDHASAIELLVRWMSDLNEIEDIHAKSGVGRNHYKQINDWYRLQVLDVILTLQRLSEGSDISIPQTKIGLRSIVREHFPRVLTSMGEPASIPTWREHVMPGCLKKENAWKQPIILSFATWIKQYLDVSAHRASRPEDITAEDLKAAHLLEEINVKCFPAYLDVSASLTRFREAEQHIQFVTTATAVGIYRLTLGRNDQSTEEQRILRLRAETSLRSAINALEQAKDDATPTTATGGLRRDVYGSSGADLLTNARTLQKQLEELPLVP